MRLRLIILLLLFAVGRLFGAETATRSFEPLAADAFMKAAAGELGTQYIPIGEFKGEKSPMLREVLQRFSDAGYLKNYQFYVMESKEWNAFASAGMASPDIVCVLTGLLNDMKSPDELAGVIAHEIAHNNHRDGLDQFMKTIAADIIAGIVFQGEGEKDDKEDEAMDRGIFVTLMQLGYSRKQESRADREGLFMLTRAGYNPVALVDLWQRIAEKYPTDAPKILLSHPPSTSRTRDLRKLVDRHLQWQDGAWVVLSEPEEPKGSDMGGRLKRGTVTGLYSGGVGLVVETVSNAGQANLLDSTARWAGAGFLVGFLFDTDFPPTLRMRHSMRNERQSYQVEFAPVQDQRHGQLAPAIIFSTRF